MKVKKSIEREKINNIKLPESSFSLAQRIPVLTLNDGHGSQESEAWFLYYLVTQ